MDKKEQILHDHRIIRKTNLGTLGLWDFWDFFETKKARDPLGQRAFNNVQKNHWKI